MTINLTRAPFHLLVGGKWVHLDGVDPGVSIATTRPTTSVVTLGNTVFTQTAVRPNRVWSLSYSWADAEAPRWLDYAASNPGAEVWFLDRTAAAINMLDPRTTKGSSATTITVDGVPMQTFTASEGFFRKVRGGVTYTLSYTTTRTAGAIVGAYNFGGIPVTFVAPIGSGARRASVSFVPPGDGTVQVGWTTANVATAARLTEAPADAIGFMEGRNTPCQVVVSDAAVTVNKTVKDGLALADSSYTISEIG